GRDDFDAAGDVGQCDEQEPVPGPGVLVQAGVLVRLEYHLQFPCAADEFVVLGGQQGAGAVGGSVDGPVGAQVEQQPLAVDRHAAEVGGHVDRDQVRAPQLVPLPVPEVEG